MNGGGEGGRARLPAFGLAEEALGGGREEHERPDRKEETKMVTFAAGGEEYGLGVSRVREIHRLSEVTRVPRAPSHIAGVINLRGNIIPLIDLARRLSIGEARRSDRSRVVVVEAGRRLLGFLVDAVRECRDVPGGLEKPLEGGAAADRECVIGIALIEGRMVSILDADRLAAAGTGRSAR